MMSGDFSEPHQNITTSLTEDPIQSTYIKLSPISENPKDENQIEVKDLNPTINSLVPELPNIIRDITDKTCPEDVSAPQSPNNTEHCSPDIKTPVSLLEEVQLSYASDKKVSLSSSSNVNTSFLRYAKGQTSSTSDIKTPQFLNTLKECPISADLKEPPPHFHKEQHLCDSDIKTSPFSHNEQPSSSSDSRTLPFGCGEKLTESHITESLTSSIHSRSLVDKLFSEHLPLDDLLSDIFDPSALLSRAIDTPDDSKDESNASQCSTIETGVSSLGDTILSYVDIAIPEDTENADDINDNVFTDANLDPESRKTVYEQALKKELWCKLKLRQECGTSSKELSPEPVKHIEDPHEIETKRKIRNREHAKKSRERKKSERETLLQESAEQEKKFTSYRTVIKNLESSFRIASSWLGSHNSCEFVAKKNTSTSLHVKHELEKMDTSPKNEDKARPQCSPIDIAAHSHKTGSSKPETNESKLKLHHATYDLGRHQHDFRVSGAAKKLPHSTELKIKVEDMDISPSTNDILRPPAPLDESIIDGDTNSQGTGSNRLEIYTTSLIQRSLSAPETILAPHKHFVLSDNSKSTQEEELFHKTKRTGLESVGNRLNLPHCTSRDNIECCFLTTRRNILGSTDIDEKELQREIPLRRIHSGSVSEEFNKYNIDASEKNPGSTDVDEKELQFAPSLSLLRSRKIRILTPRRRPKSDSVCYEMKKLESCEESGVQDDNDNSSRNKGIIIRNITDITSPYISEIFSPSHSDDLHFESNRDAPIIHRVMHSDKSRDENMSEVRFEKKPFSPSVQNPRRERSISKDSEINFLGRLSDDELGNISDEIRSPWEVVNQNRTLLSPRMDNMSL